MNAETYELTPQDIAETQDEYTENDYGENYDPEDSESEEETDYEEVEDEEDSEDEEEDEEEDEDEVEDEEDSEEEDEESDSEEEVVNAEIAALTAQGDAAEALLAKSGISYTALCTEYTENGQLSENSLAQLEKAGFPKELVENYIEGQQSRLAASYDSHIIKAAGGDSQYKTLQKWAAANLSKAEIRRYDSALDSLNIDTALTALEGLMLKYEKANGKAPEIIRGKAPVSRPATRGYASLKEMADAMDDPRYEKDMAYTHKVEQRILASDF